MGWFRVVDGRLRYHGVTRGPFSGWTTTPAGRATIDDTARHIRFSLLGRRRAATRLLWRELKRAAASEAVQSVVAVQSDEYHVLLANFAFDDLPRTNVDLRRLVAVPRALLNGRAHRHMLERVGTLPEVASLAGGAASRDFLVMALVNQMDDAFVTARPTSRAPLPAADEWVAVGTDTNVAWVNRYWPGPSWDGHHYLYELPRGGLTRKDRKRLDEAMRELGESIASWPRSRRDEILRAAANTEG